MGKRHPFQGFRINQRNFVSRFKRQESPRFRLHKCQSSLPSVHMLNSQISSMNVYGVILRTGKTAVGNADLAPAAGNLDAVGKCRADPSASRLWSMNMVMYVQISAQLRDNSQPRSKIQPQMIQLDIFTLMQKNAVFISYRIAELPYTADFNVLRFLVTELKLSRRRFRTFHGFRIRVKHRTFIAFSVRRSTLRYPFFRPFRQAVRIQEKQLSVLNHGAAVRMQFEIGFIAMTCCTAHFDDPRMQIVHRKIP